MVHIRRRRSWELDEREATPEAMFLDRRTLLAGSAGLIAGAALGGAGRAAAAALPAFSRNEAYKLDRPLTPEKDNLNYNNFYEYGTSKYVARAAEQLKPRPWRVMVDGLCGKPFQMDVDDLIAAMPIEERLYRHRCVEAWSMTIPWVGFPVAELVKRAEPKSDAKYIRMETFNDPKMASYQGLPIYPWPYVEGLTMAEAMNDLAFFAVGSYGKVLPNVQGAPLRLAVPWKYGFKSIKSIVRISFVAERPVNWWQQLQDSEYGFWANVNPAVPHPRWSQAKERVLSTGEMVPTQIYNGYGEQVAGLYRGLEHEQLFM